MPHDPAPPEKIPVSSDEDARTKEARRVIEEYADTLKEFFGSYEGCSIEAHDAR